MAYTIDLTQPDLARQVQVRDNIITPSERLPSAKYRAVLCGLCPFRDFTGDGCNNQAYVNDQTGKPVINSVQLEYIAGEFLPEGTPFPENNRTLITALLALCTLPLQRQRALVNASLADGVVDYVK